MDLPCLECEQNKGGDLKYFLGFQEKVFDSVGLVLESVPLDIIMQKTYSSQNEECCRKH